MIHKTQRPEYTLNKKSNSIYYHVIRESVTMGDSITEHIGTTEKIVDLATKVLYGGKRKHMVRNILYDINDDNH